MSSVVETSLDLYATRNRPEISPATAGKLFRSETEDENASVNLPTTLLLEPVLYPN
jgi:hypothetical protein